MSRYRKVCSCCSAHISKDQFDDNIVPSDNKDSEGNLCGACYYSQFIDNWFQVREMIQLVYDALKDPIKKFKFKFKPIEEQYNICMRLMDKGYITWQIG